MPRWPERTLEERLLDRLDVTPGCWLWTGSRYPTGYGKIKVDGRHRPAHRVAYELWVGPLDPDLVIDHLCRTRSCVRPHHLELVTSAENIRRAVIDRTRCKNGHRLRGPLGTRCDACYRSRNPITRPLLSLDDQQLRADTAAALRADGMTWQEISDRLGLAGSGHAYNVVHGTDGRRVKARFF